MINGHPCIECKYYYKPSWWERLKWDKFAERCMHPDERDEVDGTPTPCITVRINDCNGLNMFRPRDALSAGATPGE